jgi:hypothetical protein
MLYGRLRQDDYEINQLVLGGKVHTAADTHSPGIPRRRQRSADRSRPGPDPRVYR